MCGLSIVIPFSGDVAQFESTLLSVLESRPDNCEVLVVDWGRYNDPYQLRDEVRFVACAPNASLSEMVNAGSQAARGAILHYLQCGVTVAAGWCDAACRRLNEENLAWISPLVLDGEGQRVLSAGIGRGRGGARRHQRCSRKISPRRAAKLAVSGPSLWAGFYRREVFELLGGFDAVVGTTHADLDLALSADTLGYQGQVEPQCQVWQTAEDTPVPVREIATQAERLFWRHSSTVPTSSQQFTRWLLLVAMMLLKPSPWGLVQQLLGRWSVAQQRDIWMRHQRHLQELAIIKEQLARSQALRAQVRPAATQRRAA